MSRPATSYQLACASLVDGTHGKKAMKRSDPTKLTEPNLIRAVLERGGKPVAFKTLAELDALGRPPRPAVETTCERLIAEGYLVPATAPKGKGVKSTAKEHPQLWTALVDEHIAGIDSARTAEADKAKKRLQRSVSTAIFFKRAVREARCAWTRADDDLYRELAKQLDSWIAKQWDSMPDWVKRRRRSVETVCQCFDCREFGDGRRRRTEMRRKMEIATQHTVEKPADPEDAVDDAITEEMERDLKTQHDLQTQVEHLAAQQDTLARQIAPLLQPQGTSQKNDRAA